MKNYIKNYNSDKNGISLLEQRYQTRGPPTSGKMKILKKILSQFAFFLKKH